MHDTLFVTACTYRMNLESFGSKLIVYRLVSMVDVVFADVAQPDQARIVGLNAHLYLKVGGGVVVSIKANCIDSTVCISRSLSTLSARSCESPRIFQDQRPFRAPNTELLNPS